MKTALAAALLALTVGGAAFAQTPVAPPRTPYGEPIPLEMAKRVAAAADAEAAKNGWPMAIAELDSGSNLVVFQRMDNTQLGSIRLAESKAHIALDFRRPSRVMQDAVAGGGSGLWWLNVDGVTTQEGCLPIIVNDKIVGAIGASGAAYSQDAQTVQAGADAVQ